MDKADAIYVTAKGVSFDAPFSLDRKQYLDVLLALSGHGDLERKETPVEEGTEESFVTKFVTKFVRVHK